MTQHACGTTRFIGLVAPLAAGVGSASAHVKYVTPGNDPAKMATFLSAVLIDPFNLAALGTGGVGAAVAGAAYLRF